MENGEWKFENGKLPVSNQQLTIQIISDHSKLVLDTICRS